MPSKTKPKNQTAPKVDRSACFDPTHVLAAGGIVAWHCSDCRFEWTAHALVQTCPKCKSKKILGDPRPTKGVRFRGEIVGPKCPPNEHGLIIDPEIRDLIEPLTPHERGTLKTNIQRDGCLDPLKGWKETAILLDGHNRKEICETHRPEPIPFAVEWLTFPDRQSAIVWVLGNQLGRRNITPEHRAYLIGKRLENESQPRGGNRKSKVHNEPLNGDTASRIAKETGKSRATVKRSAVFAKAVDVLSHARPSLRPRLLNGSVKMSPTTAKAVVKLQPAKIRVAAERIENGVPDVAAALPAKVRATLVKPPPATSAARKADSTGLPQEFTDTLIRRLDEIEELAVGSTAKKLVREIKTFVRQWA